MTADTPTLEVAGLTVGYGAEPVIVDCDLEVREGELVLLMGRNGVGKTTLISAISGRLRAERGSIRFQGRNLSRLPAYRRSRLGIAHVPQGREMVPSFTVRENLVLAAGTKTLPEHTELIFDSFPVLQDRLGQRAGSLSGGEQQMLAVARALVMRPRLLLLDEPSMGLAPLVIEDLFQRLDELVESMSLTALLVEQQITHVWQRGLADRIYVLDDRSIVMEGPPEEFDLEDLQRTYLGAP